MAISNHPKSLESGKERGKAYSERFRRILSSLLVVAGTSGIVACGPASQNPNDPQNQAGQAGEGGQAGSAGTGGTEVGGQAGTAGQAGEGGEGGSGGTTVACEDLKFQGLASKEFKKGEEGYITIETGAYKDMKIYVKAERNVLLGILSGKFINVGDNYTELGNLEGLNLRTLNPDHPYKTGDDGLCEADFIKDDSVTIKLESSPGVYPSMFSLHDSSTDLIPTQLSQAGTGIEFKDSIPVNGAESLVFANKLPEANFSVERQADGKLIIDIAGSTDENLSPEDVLAKLGLSSTDAEFVPVPGETGKFITKAPFIGNEIPLTLEGLNKGLGGKDDTVKETIEIPNTAPEFAQEPSFSLNPTSSNIPVTITVPTKDIDKNDVTVNISLEGDNIKCTVDKTMQVVKEGNGTVQFLLTPSLGIAENVTVVIKLDDGKGGKAEWREILGIM